MEQEDANQSKSKEERFIRLIPKAMLDRNTECFYWDAQNTCPYGESCVKVQFHITKVNKHDGVKRYYSIVG